eukprot:4791484-Heterocapsa_arctica.AAC.1
MGAQIAIAAKQAAREPPDPPIRALPQPPASPRGTPPPTTTWGKTVAPRATPKYRMAAGSS